MLPDLSPLISFINLSPELKLLISRMQQSDEPFWLVGGCLRNSLLNLPQVDIDIASSADPTDLARSWGAETSGHWFWLDAKRMQSRVLLRSGLTLDFAPLRSTSIIEDLCLRDFTVNALALPVDNLFPDTVVLDPLNGIKHLHNKQLHSCSAQSFLDDPLRMLKGIRHVVTLDFELSTDTLKQIRSSKYLLANMAGERIRDELSKIFNSAHVLNGLELLISTGLLDVLLGSPGGNWDSKAAIAKISQLDNKIKKVGLKKVEKHSVLQQADSFSVGAMLLFSQLMKIYAPENLSGLLYSRLRLSRQQKNLILALQIEPSSEVLSLLESIEGRRRQALLAERLGTFFFEKILYWGVCGNRVALNRAIELQQSFNFEQKLGRVPALLNGQLISSLLGCDRSSEIGKWQEKLKLAEINGEIIANTDAVKWLKSELSFDKKET